VGGKPLSPPSSAPEFAVLSGLSPGATPVPAATTPPSVGAERNVEDVEYAEVVLDKDNEVLDREKVDVEEVKSREEFEYVCVALPKTDKTESLLALRKAQLYVTYSTWNSTML